MVLSRSLSRFPGGCQNGQVTKDPGAKDKAKDKAEEKAQDSADDSSASPPDGVSDQGADPRIVVLGPGGVPVALPPGIQVEIVDPDSADGSDEADGEASDERSITDLVEQPAKVMRVGTMIKQLLDEVKAAPLDEESRSRLKAIHQQSIRELEAGLAPELVEELERLSLPFAEDEVPSEAELRIAQAQLVGWLEGLFHGIQTALVAQQMSARAQLEQMRQHAILAADGRQIPLGPNPDLGGQAPGASGPQQDGPNRATGPYL